MLFPKFELIIQNESDTEKSTFIRNYFNVDHVFLNFEDSKIDKNLFFEIFGKLSNTKKKKKFHLKISNLLLDDDKVNMIINCIKRWNNSLEHLHLGFSGTSLTYIQLNRILIEGIAGMRKLQKIHIDLVNVKLNLKQCKTCVAFLKSFSGKCYVKLNFKREELTIEDLISLQEIIENNKKFKLMWG